MAILILVYIDITWLHKALLDLFLVPKHVCIHRIAWQPKCGHVIVFIESGDRLKILKISILTHSDHNWENISTN